MLMKKRAKPAAAPTRYWERFESLLERHAIWIAVGVVALATARIVSTYTIFSHAFDEPAHLACGMGWLEKHTYTYEPQHPFGAGDGRASAQDLRRTRICQ